MTHSSIAFFWALEPAAVMLPVAQAMEVLEPSLGPADAPASGVCSSVPHAVSASAPQSTRLRVEAVRLVTGVLSEGGAAVCEPQHEPGR